MASQQASSTVTSSTAPLRTDQAASTSPPVSISSQCHLDPACYVKGTHLLTIEQNAVLHPRCRLYTDQGPITIKQGCILNERCILGIDKELNPLFPGLPAADSTVELGIIIGSRASLQSTVKIQPPCIIGEAAILEAGVMLAPNCFIGAHSKICAGVTLPPGTKIPEWTVVYGMNGQMRRRRQMDAFEDSRLDGLGRERAGVDILLKMNATKNLSNSGGGLRSKRESIMRSDSQKG